MTTTTITPTAIDVASESFGMSSVIRQEREDATQDAWVLLVRRRTRWDAAEKLRSQSRNAMADAVRQIAIRHSVEQRAILSSLQWEQVIQPDSEQPTLGDDPEALSFGAWLHGRAHCRALVNSNQPGTCDDWRDLVTDDMIAEFERTQTLPNSPKQVQAAAARVSARLLAEIAED